MNPTPIQLLLADDDKDDCLLFKEALDELPFDTQLTTVNDGEQLMNYLLNSGQLPSALFLDLNMPRKNGFECLAEIRTNEQLKKLPVIIISTSYDSDVSRTLYNNGANHYICKPNEFEKLKKAIHKALTYTSDPVSKKTAPENFVLFNES
ncbi:MAG: transcriptional regulator [Bacteroidetes bacterium]|jgi:CheY-like chemotaxis protein|nr:transcriptional regulator [Bacteroidota bacterium]